MSYYLVKAQIKKDRFNELREKLRQNLFLDLQPFGRALSFSLMNAKKFNEDYLIWEEEDYCRPPLAQEKEAVLDTYFENIEAEIVSKGEGWKKINHLAKVFTSF